LRYCNLHNVDRIYGIHKDSRHNKTRYGRRTPTFVAAVAIATIVIF
jgi:hypothetical protein